MNGGAQRFPYLSRDPSLGPLGLMPLLPLRVGHLDVTGLLDTAATVNVLPFSLGVQLGLDWDSQTTTMTLTGNLASVEARGVLFWCVVGTFSPVRLAFAWVASDAVPLLLGQINFFVEFEVCLFRHHGYFDVRPK